MNFNIQIHQFRKKVIGILMFINRVKDIFDKDTSMFGIKTLMLSLISYGLKIWGNTNETLTQRVQKLQNLPS